MGSEPADHYAPTVRFVQAPEANRTPPNGYKERFDADDAANTAQALMDYLISYSVEHGSAATWSRKDNQVTGVAPSGSKLAISAFLPDAFDLDYWPAANELAPSDVGMVLMHMMPGFDRDHMVAWARHFVVNGRFD